MPEQPVRDEEELDRQLAELHENPATPVDSTVRRLHAELETLANNLKESVPPDPHEEESACRIAIEQAQALARELTAANVPPEADALGPMPDRLDHFRILKLLGQGGMGAVYLAEDMRLGRQVALKTLRPKLAANPVARERFLREARLAAAVEDDHIVPIYHVGESNGVPYLAMPFLKGYSLDVLLRRIPKLGVTQVISLGRQIAEGLAAAHKKGLIHRDIKPANIWVEGSLERENGEFRVKVLDFGLARLEEEQTDLTCPGSVLGTPCYMAPEQARGEKVGPRADLWSLGVVLYELSTGRRPFVGPSTLAILSRIANEQPIAPHVLDSQVPPELSDLIMQLLEKDPAKRPASARAVISALAEIEKKVLAPARATEAASQEIGRADRVSEMTVTLPPADSACRSRFRFGWAVAAGLLFVLGGGVLLSQIIIVRDKDGNEVARITVPKDGKFEIVDLGKKPDDKIPTKDEPEPGGLAPGFADPDRRAAEYVLSIGGRIRVDGTAQEILEVSELPKAPFRLTSVGLQANSKVTDAGLAYFKDCKNLMHLNLYNTRITDTGLAHFKDCKNLTHLNLYGTRVTDTGLAHFKDCKNLTHLNLYNTRITDTGLAHFKDCKNLIYLDLSATRVTDAGLTHFKDCKNLNYLHLGGTRVTDAVLASFQRFRGLQDLNLSNTQVTDAGLAHFKDCKNLRHLDLRSTQVTDAGLIYFKDCENLETLKLSWTKVGDDGLAHFKHCKNLTRLDLQSLRVTDAGLAYFKDCNNLTELYLSDTTQVTDAGLAQFKDCKNLTNLDLLGTQVTDAGLAHLKGCKNVGVLNLDRTRLTDVSLPWIEAQPLTTCSLNDTRISREGYERLKAQHPTAKISWSERNHDAAMAVLKLRGEAWIAPPQHAEPRLVQHVDELIQPFFQLRRVKLEAVKEPLADLFRRLSRLNDSQFDRMEYLDLSKSSIADLALLKGIFGLEELRLVDCELDDQKLSQLPAIPTLKRLILDGNDLRAPSVFYLATTHPQLEELSLACPNVDSSALLHLPWFKQLKRLSLAGSAVTDSGLKRLARLTTLEALDLRQTKVTPAGITELQQALPKCKIAWDGTEKD